MYCPVCSKQMVGENFGGVKVDVCKNGCKGIWFDWFELSKLDESNEGLGAALDEALDQPRAGDEGRGKTDCPKCGMKMQIHKYKKANQVTVDECYSCSGIFLDAGELGAIRDAYMSEEDERAHLDQLLADMPDYQMKKMDVQKQKERNAALGKFTRYIRGGRFGLRGRGII